MHIAEPFSLIIFDCDGVLVDSELLAASVLSEAIAELGLHLSAETCVTTFRGWKLGDCFSHLSELLGEPLPKDFGNFYRDRTAEAFRNKLQAISGVHSALKRIPTQKCTASNGPKEQIVANLTTTNLLHHFEDRIFSAYEIGRWKPDPDLFLQAAIRCGASPSSCAVIEDSEPGVRAGIAAGMRVFAYTAATDPILMKSLGAIVFDQMDELPNLLKNG